MAIADELKKLEANRANIVAAINSKGGELAENAGLAACPEAIAGLSGGGSTTSWTGHVDEAGLRYIGWNDEDIANLKANICWNEEDDADYAVPQDHKDLWDACQKVEVNGRTMLDYSEMVKWLAKDFWLRYMPFMDFSSINDISNKFENKHALIALPNLDLSKVTNINSAFNNCRMLIYLPKIGDVGTLWRAFSGCGMLKKVDINSFTDCNIESANIERINTGYNEYNSAYFKNCRYLKEIPGNFNASAVVNSDFMFQNCFNLEAIECVFSSVTSCKYMFDGCLRLRRFPRITSKVKNADGMFANCTFAVDMPDYDFSDCQNAYGIFRNVATNGSVRIDFPASADIREACNGIICKKITFKFYETNTNMGGIYGSSLVSEIEFDSASVLTGVTSNGNLPFNASYNRINKEAVTYKLVQQVCEMMLRGIPNYTADSYPMYFESGSTVTDDAAGTLQSLVEQCQAMGWAIYNLTINPYT